MRRWRSGDQCRSARHRRPGHRFLRKYLSLVGSRRLPARDQRYYRNHQHGGELSLYVVECIPRRSNDQRHDAGRRREPLCDRSGCNHEILCSPAGQPQYPSGRLHCRQYQRKLGELRSSSHGTSRIFPQQIVPFRSWESVQRLLRQYLPDRKRLRLLLKPNHLPHQPGYKHGQRDRIQ